MEIAKYSPQYKNDFIRLNTAWIEKFFKMEKDDYDELNHVDELIATGAMILFCKSNEEVIATGMVMPLGNDEWEICKFATDEQKRGLGAGSAVFRACMDYAICRGAKRLIVLSNSRLVSALHIYGKFGFTEIPIDNKIHNYERADRQFEYVVN